MSPRLPSPSRSLRRITCMSGLLVRGDEVGDFEIGDLELVGLGDSGDSGDFGWRLEALVAARATLAVTRRARTARRRDTLGVRQQRHLAGDLDRVRDVELLLTVVARDPHVADLGAIAHEPAEQVDVLVVDVLDLVDDDRARLLLVLARVGVLATRGAGGTLASFCFGHRRVLPGRDQLVSVRTALRRRR